MRGGEGVMGCPIRKKYFFFFICFRSSTTKPSGAKGLNGLSTEKRTFFCGFPKEPTAFYFLRLQSSQNTIGHTFLLRPFYRGFIFFVSKIMSFLLAIFFLNDRAIRTEGGG